MQACSKRVLGGYAHKGQMYRRGFRVKAVARVKGCPCLRTYFVHEGHMSIGVPGRVSRQEVRTTVDGIHPALP